MPRQLHVFHIVRESFKSVWDHKLDWVHILSTAFLIWVFGFVCMGLIDLSANHYAGLHFSPERHLIIAWQETPSLVALGHSVYSFCALVAMAILSINGYRYALLGEGGTKWFYLNHPKRIVKLILYSFLIGGAGVLVFSGCTVLLIALVQYFDSYGIALACVGLIGVLALYVSFRLAFIKLLISLDIPCPIRTSWNLLKGNVLRVLGLNILITLVFTVIFSLVGGLLLALAFVLEYMGIHSFALGSLLEKEVLLSIGSVFGSLIGIFSWAVLTKAYAFAFEEIGENRD